MNKYKAIIQEVLEQDERSRDNDLRLVYLVYRSIKPSILDEQLWEVLSMINKKHIPSFETIGRLGRKIKRDNPRLRGAEYIQRQTYKQQKARSDLEY